MKKKFTSLMKDIDDHKDELKGRLERQEGLKKAIEGLEKEIGVLRCVLMKAHLGYVAC